MFVWHGVLISIAQRFVRCYKYTALCSPDFYSNLHRWESILDLVKIPIQSEKISLINGVRTFARWSEGKSILWSVAKMDWQSLKLRWRF